MNIRSIIAIVALLCIWGTGTAQTPDKQTEVSERILMKVRKVELYNQILPVLMKPDQIKPLLTLIEKHRANSKKIQTEEYTQMKALEAQLDAALSAAEAKGKISGPKLMTTVLATFELFVAKRKTLINATARSLIASMRKNLNEGQIASAANAFDPRIFEPSLDPEKMTEDQKLTMWVKVVIMDPLAYDILLGMSRK